MKEELQQYGVEKIKQIVEGLEKGLEFGSEQVPLAIEELLKFRIFELSLWAGISVISCIVLIILAKRTWNWLKKVSDADNLHEEFYDTVGPFAVICSIAAVLSSVFILCRIAIPNILEVAKIYIAPRLYLIEYLRELL